jgi:pre-peptidase
MNESRSTEFPPRQHQLWHSGEPGGVSPRIPSRKVRGLMPPGSPRFSMTARVLGGLFVWMSAGWIDAAPPEVTSLFPAGAQRGTSASVTIQGKLGNGAVRVWCSRPGVKAMLPEKPGPITVDVATEAEPGVCWLRFINDEGSSGLRPFVVGTLPEIMEVEPNDDWKKAQTLDESAVVVNGQHMKGGDADSFAVALKQGQTVVASLMANRVIASTQDAVLQMLSPGGFVLDQNEDDQGFDPQLAFMAPADGTYFLRTWALPMTPDSSIRLFGSPAAVYRLTVTTGPFVDRVLPLATQAGATQRLELRGWNIGVGEINVEPPVSALSQRFAWPLPGWSHRLPASVLVVTYPTRVEREPNDLSQSQGVELPIGMTGHIASPGDVDAFQFVGKKGQRLQFEVIAREVGSLLDPVLRIYDAKGTVLKEADDDGKTSADPDIEFAPPADGEYRVAVTDRFAHHGERYVYLLNMTESAPDFTLSVAGDSFVLKPDKELEVPVTVSRAAGFADAIEFSVTGLPDGVTAQSAKSDPKGASAKTVKLMLKTNGEAAFSGPIRIVGRSVGGERSLERMAVAPLKAFGAETSQLWLTGVANK